MPGHAIDDCGAIAHLRPPGPALRTGPAALIVMKGDAVADPDGAGIDIAADRRDDTARLMAGDHRLTAILEAKGFECSAGGRAIQLQVAAAHSRSLDLEHDVPRSGGGIGKVDEFQGTVAGKYNAAHGSLPFLLSLLSAR